MTYNVLSMFCGCGGFDLGFEQSGFDIIWANDFDKDACRTYRRNFGNKYLVEGDITKIPIPDLEKPVHVLLAGFPCQPFSSAGKKLSGDDSRGRLYQTCMNYINEFQPEVVFFENVRGVLKSQGIERKFIIEDICDDLIELGYEFVYISLIEATMYGVPQKRQRVIITASKKPFEFPTPVSEELDLSIEAALNDITPDIPNSGEIQKICDRYLSMLKHIPPGGCWDDIPYDELPKRFQKIRDNKKKYKSPRFFRRHCMSDISTTIKAKSLPETSAIWHPLYDRSLSVREVARIQSFPDNFVFDGRSVCSNYRVIGNAVPPRLSYNLAQAAKKMLAGNVNNLINNDCLYRSEETLSLGDTVRYLNSELT